MTHVTEKYKFLIYQPRSVWQRLVGAGESEPMHLKHLIDDNHSDIRLFLETTYSNYLNKIHAEELHTEDIVDECATECMMQVLRLWMHGTQNSQSDFPFEIRGSGLDNVQRILKISDKDLETRDHEVYKALIVDLANLNTTKNMPKYYRSYYFRPTQEMIQNIKDRYPKIPQTLTEYEKADIERIIGNHEYKLMLEDKEEICKVLCQIARTLAGYDNSSDKIGTLDIFKTIFDTIRLEQKRALDANGNINSHSSTSWEAQSVRFVFFKQVVNFYIVTELSHQADIESTEDPGRKEKVQDAHTRLLNSILAFVPTKERDAFARQLEDHGLITPAETPWLSARNARRYLNLLSLFVADKPIGGSIGLGIHSISVMVQSLSTLYFALAMLGAIQLSRTPQRLLPTQNLYLTDIPNADVLPFALGILELAANGYTLFFRQHSHILEFNSAEHLIITSRHISRILFMHQLSPFDLLLFSFLQVRFMEQWIYRMGFIPLFRSMHMLPQQLTNKQLEKYACLARYSLSILWTLSSLHEQYQTRIQESNEIQNQSILPIPVLGAMLQPAVQFTCEMVFTKMPVHKLGLGIVINVLIAVESGEFKVFTSYNDFDRMGRNLIRRLPLRFNQLRNYALGEPEKSHIEQSLRIITNFIIHYFDPRQNIAMDILADAVNTIVTIPFNILHATFGNDCRVVDFRVQGIPTDNYKQFTQVK